jgi:L-threonylcarbamoyladenylate synthase
VSVEAVVAAVRAGEPAILPTDTVYGLCCDPYRGEPVRRAYELKGRPPEQPSALLAADVELLLECLPELRGRAGTVVRALLPGPYTLVLPNPAGRFRWLTGGRPGPIGVRVPELAGDARAALDRLGAVMATSANLRGGPDPRRLDEVPPELLDGVAAVLDAGELPGTPSTVVDLTGERPEVLREGAVPAAEALDRAAAALG